MEINWKTLNVIKTKPNYKFTKIQKIKPIKMKKVEMSNCPTLLYLDIEPFGRFSYKNVPYIKELGYILVQNGTIIEQHKIHKTFPSITQLTKLIIKYKPVLVAHNGIFYDFPIIIAHAIYYGLLHYFKPLKFVDTYQSAKRFGQFKKKYSNFALFEQCFPNHGKNIPLHNADVDVTILRLWVEKTKLPLFYYDFDQLVEYQQKY